uniref:Uncharacterized protein n=1 Tax=Anguilla anguilla TaxID=7936 RepID=A0A0E9PNJ7_ANGAN
MQEKAVGEIFLVSMTLFSRRSVIRLESSSLEGSQNASSAMLPMLLSLSLRNLRDFISLMESGTVVSWLWSRNSSDKERKDPKKDTGSTPSLSSSLKERYRYSMPGSMWANT